MALPWSTLVKAIPWSEVIARAPDLAQSARKLWQKAGPDTAAGSASQSPEGASPGDTPRFVALESQLAIALGVTGALALAALLLALLGGR